MHTVVINHIRLGMFTSCCLQDTVPFISQGIMQRSLILDDPAETAGHSLAATLGFLSIHEDIQEEAFEQIISVVGYDRDPVSSATNPRPLSHPQNHRYLKIIPGSTKSLLHFMKHYECSVSTA